ncbi:MAG: guanylate kinase [Butyrivibrio sp.]|nr:guanylate kinase [Butyrivibrio sp.]
MNHKGLLVVISGFSGTGKGTLVKEIMKKYDNYSLSVSMTTRSPRTGEVDGVDYHFVTNDEFEKLIKEDGFIEHAGYCDHYYGTPKKFVENELNNGRDVILEIEMQGALQVKEKYPETLLLFVTPPSITELERRLRGRGTETEEVIMKRLSRAKEEAVYMDKYDYLIINDKLDECVTEMNDIINAARRVPVRNIEFIGDIKNQLDRY